MKKSTLDKAIAEAFRFLEAAKAVQKACQSSPIDGEIYHTDSPKHTGAVKRASMDLTRALADVRRRNA